MALINLLALTTVNRAKLYQGQPATTSATLYTAPASTDVKIMSIVVSNTTAAVATITLAVSTGTTGATKQILSATSVGANDTLVLDAPIMMTAADIITGLQGTASALTVTISGETYA